MALVRDERKLGLRIFRMHEEGRAPIDVDAAAATLHPPRPTT